MRWTGRRHKESPVRDPGQGRPDEAREARRAAEAGLKDARDQWRAVLLVAASLRRVRETNHFAETVAETMRRRSDI